MSDFTPTPTPSYSGKLRNHMLMVPECIEECSGIRIFGRTIKSFVFSTDVATIASCNADAVIAVYPFTPQPRIARAIISVADMPVFCGVGGGFTSGARSVAQAMEAEHCGAYGVVLNAPVSADIMRDIRTHIDIPVVATIVSATQDTEARIAAGADILNVSAAAETPQLVAALQPAGYAEVNQTGFLPARNRGEVNAGLFPHSEDEVLTVLRIAHGGRGDGHDFRSFIYRAHFSQTAQHPESAVHGLVLGAVMDKTAFAKTHHVLDLIQDRRGSVRMDADEQQADRVAAEIDDADGFFRPL